MPKAKPKLKRPKKREAGEHRRRGEGLAVAGKLPAAEREFREALRLVPDDAKVLEGLAAVLERQGREQEALEYRERHELLERWPMWDDTIRRSLEGPD
jgi:Flp pilus assembly protein TadD